MNSDLLVKKNSTQSYNFGSKSSQKVRCSLGKRPVIYELFEQFLPFIPTIWQCVGKSSFQRPQNVHFKCYFAFQMLFCNRVTWITWISPQHSRRG